MRVVSFGKVGHDVGSQAELDAFNRARAARGEAPMTMPERLQFLRDVQAWKEAQIANLKSAISVLQSRTDTH